MKKCKDCYYRCLRRGDGDTECFYEAESQASKELKVYWQSFRSEAAKDILCSILCGATASGLGGIIPEKENLVNVSICVAEELIKQLKEKEIC